MSGPGARTVMGLEVAGVGLRPGPAGRPHRRRRTVGLEPTDGDRTKGYDWHDHGGGISIPTSFRFQLLYLHGRTHVNYFLRNEFDCETNSQFLGANFRFILDLFGIEFGIF